MSPAGFEPSILASERPQTHCLDRSATEIKRIAEFNETKPTAHPEKGTKVRSRKCRETFAS